VLADKIDFSDEALDALPARSGVFILRGSDGAEPYVAKSANLKQRLLRLLGPPEEGSKKLNLRQQTRTIEYSVTGSDFENRFLLYRTLREIFPNDYRERMKLRAAPLIRLNLDNEYPRAYITRKIGRLTGKSIYYGPFASRAAAEKFLNGSLDFFKMRRCDFDLNPDPAFPGCMYSEMKMCLAPCFKGCTDEAYHVEVSRVQTYLDSGGASLRREIEAQREAASAAMEFENAATIHARMEKLAPVAHLLPDVARPLSRLSGVMIQTSSEPNSVALLRISKGMISSPVAFAIEQASSAKSQSMESRLAAAINEIPAAETASATELTEHIALLKRWFFRRSRTGEIFLCDEKGELPMRRLVRGVSRVYRGEKEIETGPIELN
jgi:excinuclease UvrABC nuclease subunit